MFEPPCTFVHQEGHVARTTQWRPRELLGTPKVLHSNPKRLCASRLNAGAIFLFE